MSELNKLGNKNKDTNSSLQCIFCGRKEELNLVAHRNNDTYITGFVAVCSYHLPLEKNLYIKVVKGK